VTTTAIAQDMYELSPMQRAMLFHALHHPGRSTSFNQFSGRITGSLDPRSFRQAWQNLLDRHTVLRTSFQWELLDKPMQIVHPEVELPWTELDWRGLPEAEQRERFQQILEDDLAKGFSLDQAPLMRCALARIEDARYLFLWSHHHLLTDGWCLSLVMEEVFAHYAHLAQGEPLVLNDAPPYRDYIDWLERQDIDAARQFWTRYLEGFNSPTRMPAASHGAAGFGAATEQLHAQLSPELSSKLKAFAREHRLTLNTVVQGAWAILLARYATETDVIFGTTVAGRPSDLPGVETMLGLFINTVPVRVRVDPRQSLVPWLRMIQARQAARSQFEYAPLPEIQRWSEVPPATPLFESNVIFMNYPLDHSLIAGAYGIAIDQVQLYDRADVPVELQVTAQAQWEIDLAYDPERFEHETMQRMLGHYGALLEQFADEPARAIGRFSLLTADEREQVLRNARGPDVPFDASRTLVHRLEQNAAEHPERTAVECEGRSVSFAELNARANRLARHMMAMATLQQDDLVAILAPRSERMMEAILAVWKCGAAYVPIDPEYPAERIRTILADSRAKLLITTTELLSGTFGTPIVNLDDNIEGDGSNLLLPVLPGSLAYVIYTSGSTGTPKGAMVEHAGMLNHMLAKVNDFSLDASTIIAQNASHCFDISVWQFFVAPLAGGRTVILGNELVHDVPRFLSCIESTGVNLLEVVPSYLALLLEQVSSQRDLLQHVRYLFVTGEIVSPLLVEAWFRLFPDVPVVNAYGPTEASDDITHHVITQAEGYASIPLGKPIQNLRLYVVDEQMNLCPPGVNGEICVSGIGVGRGYVGNDAQTRSVFLDDPFHEQRGVRMYRTGDIGCMLPDGVLTLAGRRDHQIKIRGYRIELGEIETALRKLTQIREAVVTAYQGADRQATLCAYVVFRDAALPDAEISTALGQRLPEYMVPAVYIVLEQMPLTRNGKVDRSALPSPGAARLTAKQASTPPRNPVEATLCAACGEALGIASPGVHDNVFALGGDSILSMRIVALAARAGLKITTRQIFQHPTIAELATLAVPLEAKAIEPQVHAGPLPLTPIQERFFEQRKHDQNQYNQSVLLEVPAALDTTLLQAALQSAAQAHDAFRLRFHKTPTGWSQEIVAGAHLPLTIHDITPSELAQCIDEAHASLDITHGPLARAVFFRFAGDATARLLLLAHHLIIDGVSWGIFLETLYSSYKQITAPPPTAAWASFAVGLEGLASSGALEADRAFWTSLAGRPVPALPVDLQPQHGPNLVSSAEEVHTSLDERLTTALLTTAPQAYRAHVNDLLLAALCLALERWTGATDIAVDLEAHGRNELMPGLDLTRTMGWFTAIYPVVFHLDESRDSGSILKSVKETLRSVPNGGLSYGLLRSSLSARLPRPQILFNYLGQTDQLFPASFEWKLASESSGAGRSPQQLREYPFTLNCYVSGGRLHIAWEFSRNLHHAATVRALAHSYTSALSSLIEHCSTGCSLGFTPSDFPLASLTQSSLDTLTAQAPSDVEDMYALAPTQQGMLFHSLYEPDAEAYINNFSCLIEGDLSVERFQRAWADVVQRHPVLRTSFHYEGLESPVQVVHRHVDIPWQLHHKQTSPHRFDLTHAPLLRLSLHRVGEAAWRFNWCQHHILLDGWSTGLVMRDVIAAYDALAYPTPPPFREHIAWLKTQDLSAAEAFWTNRLASFTLPTPLPLSPAEMTGAPGAGTYVETELLLSASATAQLTAFAQQQGLTMNTVAQAAWALLLHRYSGESDVVFGTIVSGRPDALPDVDNMVGLFINALPVRCEIAPEPLGPWLRKLQASLAQQNEFAYYPLAEIQKRSGVPSNAPLFESLLIFQNYPIEDAMGESLAGIRIREVQAFDPNNYPLSLVVTPGARLSVRALFNNARFDRETVDRMLGHIETLVSSFAGSAEVPITTLPILTTRERHQILHEWNDTAVPIPSDKTLVDLIEATAQENPQSIAVRCGVVSRSYGDLLQRANRIAGELATHHGIRPGDRVALLMPRSITMIETILAIWKRGAAYVPVDPGYPEHRIQTILSAAKPSLVLREDSSLYDAAGQSVPCASICGPEDVSYVIFTSGSTGQPKGAMVEQRGMLNHVLAMVRRLQLGHDSIVAQTASHCSDISVWQTFAALVAGGETIIYPDAMVLEPSSLIDALRRDGVTAMQFVPTYLATFLDELRQETITTFPALRHLLAIGEVLQPAHVRAWFALNPEVPLLNTYGPTEASDSIAHYIMRETPALPSIPLGRPIQNLRLYILDSHKQLCPIGVKGEICVAGVGVGRGYLFDETRTRAVFEDDPFSPEPGVRMYHTGDLGCFAPDGNILFFGRRDFQVKIRGYRVELGEIETTITSLDGISQAVVVARSESDGATHLRAYATGKNWTPATLRLALAERLPAHMLPDSVMLLDEMPVTPNGKIHRAALPLPQQPATVAAATSAPRSPVEAALGRIFAETLQRDAVSMEDNFFDIGGHSLKAMLLIGRIRRELGLEVSIADIFSRPTPRALAEKLSHLTQTGSMEIQALPPQPWHPVSRAQKRIWLASRGSGASTYNMAAALQLDGEIDTGRLASALEQLVDRHESLRTVFDLVQGSLQQKILTRADSGFQVERLAIHSGLDILMQREAQQPFELSKGPLFRATILDTGPSIHVLLLTLHHIVADAWSMTVLTRDLRAFYEGRALAPLSIQYRDYAAWHNEQLNAMQLHREFWKSELRGAPHLALPFDHTRPSRSSHNGSSLALDLDASTTAKLHAFARRLNTSLYNIVLASICILLARESGSDDLLIGTVSAGRDHQQLEAQIGVFLNPVALRVRMPADSTIEKAIHQLIEASTRAQQHAAYPFDLLLEELKIRSIPNQTSLFGVQVDYVADLEPNHNLPVRVLAQEDTTSKFDLSFHVVEEADTLHIALLYNADLYRDETIRTMRDRLIDIQNACLDTPDMPIASIPLTPKISVPQPKIRVGLRLKPAVAEPPFLEP
jgi:amino acid adenylation domain-containing protein/non-ribosomal peptide synthase protein (TIGR01720 family)